MQAESWDQVKEVFGQARDLPLAEQRAFVDERFPDNPDLAAEVLSLLDADREAAERGEPAGVQRFLAEAHAEAPDDRPRQLGPYTLTKLLGEGGMGEVWLAEQKEPIERSVALKIIKLGMDTKQVVARFEAERQALAVMDHPHIARVLDGGATSDGRPYFVMEVVDGAPINEYADQSRLGIRDRIRVFIDVCRAVQHAHQKGVLHRDLKPSNLMVSEHDGVPVVKVIDFGIAKAIHGERSDSQLHTAIDQVVGTPEYMSPEQANPDSTDVDTRTDVYSLGVVLYELLAGARPHELKGSGWAALAPLLTADAPKPSDLLTSDTQVTVAGARATSPADLRRELTGDLDWVVMKAIEKDRDRRYETVQEFQADVERYLANEPVLARPPSLGYQARKFVRRHRAAVMGSAAVLVALVAGIVATTVGLVRAQRAEAAATAAEAERAIEARTAQRTSDFMIGLFQAGNPEVAQGRQITALELLDRGAEQIRTDLAAEPLVQARMMQSMGRAYRYLGYSERGADLAGESIEQLEAELGPDHPEIATALLAFAPPRESDADRRARVVRAHRIREAALIPGDSLWLESFTMAVLAESGCLGGPDPASPTVQTSAFCPQEGALAHLPDSLKVLEAHVVDTWGPESGEAASFRLSAGRLLLADRRWSEARDFLATAEEGYRALGDRAKAAEAANELGNSHMGAGEFGASRVHLQRAYDYLPDDDPAMAGRRAMAHLQVANAALFEGERLAIDEGRNEEAIPLLEEAEAGYQAGLDVLDDFGVTEYLTRLSLYNQLLWVRSESFPNVGDRPPDLASIEEALRGMLTSLEAMYPVGHPEAANRGVQLAWVLADQGRSEEADSLITDVLRRSLVFVSESGGDQANESYRRVVADWGRLRAESTGRGIEELEAPLMADFTRDDRTRADVLHVLGNLMRERGSAEAAGAYWRRGLALRERALGAGHVETASLHVNLANLALAQGDVAAAERGFERVRDMFAAAEGGRIQVLLTALSGLEGIHTRAERWDELLDLRVDILEAYAEAFGSLARQSAYPRMWLGWSLSRAGRLDEAVEAFQTSQAQFESWGEAYNVAWARAGQGFVALDRGDLAAAADHLRFALSIWEEPEQQRSWWAEHALVAQTLAEMARDAGQLEEAERLFQQAEDVLATPLGPMGYDRFMTQTPVEELRTRLEVSRAGG